MIRRSTVVYITILLAVTAVFLYVNNRKQPAGPETTPEPAVSYLFPPEEGSPVSILIQAKSGETVELARNSEEAWTIRQPVEASAEQGSSEAAASQVMAMRILDKTSKIDPAQVGLKDPQYTLSVNFKDGAERIAHIGVVTPTESGYYAQDSTGGDVLIISKSSVDALLGLLTVPPYLETPTPNPALSGTGTATSEATATP
jgi:hypothetical protein